MSLRPTAKEIKEVKDAQGIRDGIAYVFQEAQLTLSGHRKLVVILKGFHKRAIELGIEDAFVVTFINMITRILPLKKGEPVGDRIVKFCSIFVASSYRDLEASDKNSEKNDPENTNNKNADIAQIDTEEDEDDSPIARLVDYLLRHLLRGIQAKDRHVRFRVVQFLAYLVNYIKEIDAELFTALQWSLNRRLNDKEAHVRLQAVVAISRFQTLPTAEGKKATTSLLMAMQNDENAEVRRAALLNLEKSAKTIPKLIERARDVNSINRRLVYLRISKELGDFRDLDSELKDNLLCWGLNDRDVSVEMAAVNMFTKTWYELVQEDFLDLIEALNVVNSEVADVAVAKFYENRQDFLTKVSITPDMWRELSTDLSFFLRTFFEHCNKNSLFELIEKYYPETIELSEILLKYFKLRKKYLDDNAPISTKYNHLLSQLQKLRLKEYLLKRKISKAKMDEEGMEFLEEWEDSLSLIQEAIQQAVTNVEDFQDEYLSYYEPRKDLEFIIIQLVKISRDYDFSDEIGRREMLRIIRSALANDELSDELIKLVLQVLRKISINERDFSAMCTEIVADLRDSEMDDLEDDTFHSAISVMPNNSDEIEPDDEDDDDRNGSDNQEDDEEDDEENDDEYDNRNKSGVTKHHKARKQRGDRLPRDEILIQCLRIIKHLLEIVEDLNSNVSLIPLKETMVIPSVRKNDNVEIRELALSCLGLYCLLDKKLAIYQLYLFGIAAAKADESLRILTIKIVFDILAVHGTTVLDLGEDGTVDSLSLANVFQKLLRAYEMPKLQCTVAEGLFKLFLADAMSDYGKRLSEIQDQDDLLDAERHPEKELFETLFLTYFHPKNVNNHELRQILAFCIPVYAFSHVSHQEKIAGITGDCIFRLFRIGGIFDDFGGDTQISPSNILQQFIFWGDSENVVKITDEGRKKSTSHFWQLLGLLQAIEQETPKNIKKTIIMNFHRFNIYPELGSTMLNGLKKALEDTRMLVDTSQDDPSFNLDIPTLRSFDKFHQLVTEAAEVAEATEAEAEAERINESNTSIMSQSSIKEGNEKRLITGEGSLVTKGGEREGDHEVDEDGEHEDEIDGNGEEDGDLDVDKDENRESQLRPNLNLMDIDLAKEQELNDSLQKIDQLLEDEDEVLYEIDNGDDEEEEEDDEEDDEEDEE